MVLLVSFGLVLKKSSARRRDFIRQAISSAAGALRLKILSTVTDRTPKLCIPSPTILHMRRGSAANDKQAYPDMEKFYADLARVYSEEIYALADVGCTYLQLDDPNMAYLCDEKMRESVRHIGEDPDQLPHTYAKL